MGARHWGVGARNPNPEFRTPNSEPERLGAFGGWGWGLGRTWNGTLTLRENFRKKDASGSDAQLLIAS